MFNLIASVAETSPASWFDALKPYGAAGICLAFFMWLHVKQGERDASREAKRDERDAKREQMMWSMIQAVDRLANAISMDVNSRPVTMQRRSEEARNILSQRPEQRG